MTDDCLQSYIAQETDSLTTLQAQLAKDTGIALEDQEILLPTGMAADSKKPALQCWGGRVCTHCVFMPDYFCTVYHVFKVRNNMSPSYISELLTPYIPPRTLRSSDKCLLKTPRTSSTSLGDCAFSVAAPILWNSLPLHLRQTNSLYKFKTGFKTFLFNVAYKS